MEDFGAKNTPEALRKAVGMFQEQAQWLGPEVSVLWDDALTLWAEAVNVKGTRPDSRREKERLLRAAVLGAAAAFEAWTNFLADRLIKSGEPLTESEGDVLRERKRVVEDGHIKVKPQYYKARERFLLLYRLVSIGGHLEEKRLKDLEAAFRVRDELVHPKPGCVLTLDRERKGFDAVMGFFLAEIMLVIEFRKRFGTNVASPAKEGVSEDGHRTVA